MTKHIHFAIYSIQKIPKNSLVQSLTPITFQIILSTKLKDIFVHWFDVSKNKATGGCQPVLNQQ